jgi:hypothetical protein
MEHAPGESAVSSTALQGQIDHFLRSDVFLHRDRVDTRTGRAGVLIDQFHCHGGISRYDGAVDNSTLLHCKERNFIFLADLVFRKRKVKT